MAGSTSAQALTSAGIAVHVVDKSRGAGGRLATRRLEWLDPDGQRRLAELDHGAPAFSAGSADFRLALACALPAKALVSWTPSLASGSRPIDGAEPFCVPQPNMPSLCRWLLRDTPTTWDFAVDRLVRGPLGWQVEAGGSTLPGHFDAVVLALPPAQAAPLLVTHKREWAQRAALVPMQACWTLLGVARRPVRLQSWDLARPEKGPLAWIMQNDARPGRDAAPGEVQWVAHARAGWSRQHLEQPADWVQARMHEALSDQLGEPVEWKHAVVHRWRYAMPLPLAAAPESPCWWDAQRGLGVCGDFLGGTGVEGSWRSAQALSKAVLSSLTTIPAPADTLHGDRPFQHMAA